MSAVIEPGNSGGVAPAPTAARVSARAAAVALAVVAIAFGAAYLIGSTAKKTTSAATPAGQLAPASPLRGQSSVQIAVPGAAGAIPALAQISKPKPAHHAQAAAQTQASASASQTSTPAPSSTASGQQTVVPQPVRQPVVQHCCAKTVQPPPPPPPPVVVVHGG
jgi:hypothetical protein